MVNKDCKWCGDEYELKSPNQKYCSPKCSKEGRLESKRESTHRHYLANKKRILVKKLGTDDFGQHMIPDPTNDFQREQKVVENELKRVVHSEHKNPKWADNNRTQTDYNPNSSPASGQKVHQFATANDYTEQVKDLVLRTSGRPCEECGSHNLEKDYKRAERVCKDCGLVQENPWRP